MYSVELNPHLIRVYFSKVSDKIQLLKIIDFYSGEGTCVISRITLIRYANGAPWYNDIKPYRKGAIIATLARLRDESIRGEVESTHIMDSSLLNYSAVIEIHTLNRDNVVPELPGDEEFRAKLFKELISQL